MNSRQLMKLGVPEYCVGEAIMLIQELAKAHRGKEAKDVIAEIVANPDGLIAIIKNAESEYLAGEIAFAKALVENRDFVRPEPISYKTWGTDIDKTSHDQMALACKLPMATGAAIMPDGHVGYGLPIGGVLALDNAIVPYAVGVDIACRMKLSFLDIPVGHMEQDRNFDQYKNALEKGTRFGVGVSYGRSGRKNHDVMDDYRWNMVNLLKTLKDKAWEQLGTSGSGNHFVEFGVVTLDQDDEELGLKRGRYLSLLSHSGSRGAGSKVCNQYSGIAKKHLPDRYKDMAHLAWLDMDSADGQEYWAAMNLMGDYASANHDVLHKQVVKYLGANIIGGVENHHNFAWIENHGGKDVVVHRKGATPAGKGVLGVIPGSMASPAFIVRGKGNEDSLRSASHGAGRAMSRTKAKEKFNWKATKNNLAKRGVKVLSAGADEVPGVYKDIHKVMAEQTDLVDVVAKFDPKIVKMAGDNDKPRR